MTKKHKKTPAAVDDKIFCSRISSEVGNNLLHQRYPGHLQSQQIQSQTGDRSLERRPNDGSKSYEVPRASLLQRSSTGEDYNSTSLTKKLLTIFRPSFRMSVERMEKLARVLMFVVFFIFNVIYWTIAYGV